MIEAYKRKMRELPPKKQKMIKTGFDVAIVIVITLSVIHAYDSGKVAGKVEFCHDLDMILVQQGGIYTCEIEKDYIERKQSTTIGVISDKNWEDNINQNGLQLNITQ